MSDPAVAPPKWVLWIATWFGCGYAKKAPGTVGSLGAVPLFLLISGYNPLLHCGTCCGSCFAYWGIVLTLTILGIVCSERMVKHSGIEDPQHIVIDEVAGSLIAMGLARGQGLHAVAVAWLLFRVLDIYKPWPISAAEHARPAGLGIMLDDLLAGAVAGGVTLLIFSRF